MAHVIFLISWIFSIPTLNRKFSFIFFSFTILFLFLALRYDYGNDYLDYLYIHQSFNEGMSAWGEKDVLFKQLNLLVSDFKLMIAIISFFYIMVIYYLVKKEVPYNYYWLSVIILLINPYLFLIHLSSVRQTIALCFFIIAVYFAINKKVLMYFIFILIASGFHKSALLLLPIYFFLNLKSMKMKYLIILIFSLASLLFTPLFDFVLNSVILLFPRYDYYLTFELGNSLRSTILSFFFFIMIVTNINKLKGKEIVFGKLALIATTLSILSYKVSMITRLNIYFEIFMVIAIPLIIYRTKRLEIRLVWLTGAISIYLLRYYSFFQDPLWKYAYGTYKTIIGNP